MHLKKLIRVGENASSRAGSTAYISSCGPFKVLWSRSSKMLLGILEVVYSRAVLGDLGLVVNHPRRRKYDCLFHNDEQITSRWYNEDVLDSLQGIELPTYLSNTRI